MLYFFCEFTTTSVKMFSHPFTEICCNSYVKGCPKFISQYIDITFIQGLVN
ncbi:hypothetical protein SAMN03097699_2875 [Flavobacteriaceae bacterium MAR_2010_188]|nr:hypothetical protein SAMN03097699_2875 [Flavobacteriaceae bacterium MAR_2010_188]